MATKLRKNSLGAPSGIQKPNRKIERSRKCIDAIRQVIDQQIHGLNNSIALYNHHLRIVNRALCPLEVTIRGHVRWDEKEIQKEFRVWKKAMSKIPNYMANAVVITGEDFEEDAADDIRVEEMNTDDQDFATV